MDKTVDFEHWGWWERSVTEVRFFHLAAVFW